jgi:hypothetical protein
MALITEAEATKNNALQICANFLVPTHFRRAISSWCNNVLYIYHGSAEQWLVFPGPLLKFEFEGTLSKCDHGAHPASYFRNVSIGNLR